MERHEVEIESPTCIGQGIAGGIRKSKIRLAYARGKVVLPKLPMQSKRSFTIARGEETKD
jgi:hypothetical protein